MNSIFLLSSDVELLRCVQIAAGGVTEVTRCSFDDALPRNSEGLNDVVVIDWRHRNRSKLVATMSTVRKSMSVGTRCVAIVSALPAGRAEVVTTSDTGVTELVVLECESIADVILGFVNDPSRTDAAAVAIAILAEKLPQSAYRIIVDVIGSGLTRTSVKQLSAMRHVGRDSMTESLQGDTSMTADIVVDLAKASFAVMLLRDRHFGIAAIARKVGYANERPLKALCERVWRVSAAAIREDSSQLSSEKYLSRQIDRFLRAYPMI